MDKDRRAELITPERVVVDVIQMAMRVPDGDQTYSVALQVVHARSGFAAVNRRIDHDGFTRRLINKQVKVIGERPDDKGFNSQAHAAYLIRNCHRLRPRSERALSEFCCCLKPNVRNME